jgi:predicted Zn-dependent protease
MRWFLPVLLSGVVLFGLGAKTDGRVQFGKPNAQTQIKLGEQAAADLRRKSKMLPDSDDRVKVLRRVASRILATFPRNEPWHYTFDVIDSKEVNAFALPGGPTFFYTGLLNKMSTEDEIAGVVGHELTHVRREHWAHAYADSQKRGLLLTGAAILLHVNRTIMDFASVANSLYDLKYSRGDETQADDGGFEAMTAAGFNPMGLADTFRLLDEVVGSGKTPEFISDHPGDASRIKRVEGKIASMNRTFPAQVPLPWKPEPVKSK